MANSTSSTHSFSSKGKSSITSVHPRIDASYNCNDTSNHRSSRSRNIWRYLQQLVGNQRSTQWEHRRPTNNLLGTHSRRAVSDRDCDTSSRCSRADRHRSKYYNKLHYYLAFSLLAVNPVMADDVYNTAAPESTATGNVTNQAVQCQNNGAPSRQHYGGGIVCNGSTLTLTPFYMGNDTIPMDPDSYVTSNNWGGQLSFMVPLDFSTVRRCKSIAKRQEEKLRLDYELVRALKCAELQQKGFTFRPGSRVEHLCNDVVPIALLNKQTTENLP